MDERLVVGGPVGDFELLFCHVISLQDQECGDLILTTAKSSIYSTTPKIGRRKDTFPIIDPNIGPIIEPIPYAEAIRAIPAPLSLLLVLSATYVIAAG